MIEVLIHSILYVRDIYPIGIFKKGQIYSKVIYQSIYPPLNEYIGNVLSTARQLKRLKQLYKIELQIYQDDANNSMNVIENYVFEIKQLDDVFQINNKLDDKYLIEFEENVRIILLNLDDKMKQLKKLPTGGAKFKINLQTTQSNFVKLTNNNELEVMLFYIYIEILEIKI